MKPGTPFFVGPRLREAREARGLSVATLADLVDVARETIYQIEADRITPGPALFSSLQDALRMPPAFFFDPVEPDASDDADVLFRSLSSATKPARQRAKRRLGWLRRVSGFVQEFVDLPRLDVPDYGLAADPVAISDDEIEQIASDLRQRWALGAGPISNVTWLIENHGVIVAREDLGADELDAVLMREHANVFVLLGADKASAVRSRMDVGHELGHVVLHPRCPRPKSDKDPNHKLMEQQAFRFAGAFLLPAESFAQDIWSASLEELLALKPKWRMAVSAMILRAAHLGLISENQKDKLWRQHTFRKWKRSEPYDDEWSTEQPALLRRSFELIREAGVASVDRILNEIKLPASDIESLAGLPRGSLTEGIIPLTFRAEAVGHAAETGTVVTFPSRSG